MGIPRLNSLLRGNSPRTSTYPESIRSPAPPLGLLGSQWIEGTPTSYLNLVVTSSQSQWPCLQVTLLWVGTRKKYDSHLTTSAMDADPLRKKRLRRRDHILRGADIFNPCRPTFVSLTCRNLASARAGHLKHDYPTLENRPEGLINKGIFLTSMDDSSIRLARIAEPNNLYLQLARDWY